MEKVSVNRGAEVRILAVPTLSQSVSSGQPSCTDIWNSPAWNLVVVRIRNEFKLKVVAVIQIAPVIGKPVVDFFGRT